MCGGKIFIETNWDCGKTDCVTNSQRGPQHYDDNDLSRFTPAELELMLKDRSFAEEKKGSMDDKAYKALQQRIIRYLKWKKGPNQRNHKKRGSQTKKQKKGNQL